jgi:hypothetical protein
LLVKSFFYSRAEAGRGGSGVFGFLGAHGTPVDLCSQLGASTGRVCMGGAPQRRPRRPCSAQIQLSGSRAAAPPFGRFRQREDMDAMSHRRHLLRLRGSVTAVMPSARDPPLTAPVFLAEPAGSRGRVFRRNAVWQTGPSRPPTDLRACMSRAGYHTFTLRWSKLGALVGKWLGILDKSALCSCATHTLQCGPIPFAALPFSGLLH